MHAVILASDTYDRFAAHFGAAMPKHYERAAPRPAPRDFYEPHRQPTTLPDPDAIKAQANFDIAMAALDGLSPVQRDEVIKGLVRGMGRRKFLQAMRERHNG